MPLHELQAVDFNELKNANRNLASLAALGAFPGISFPSVIPGIGQPATAAPKIDINQLIQLFGPILAMLIAQWTQPRPTPVPTPEPTPAPIPLSPGPIPVSPPLVRRIASLRCHWIGWEDYSMRPGEKHAFHHGINANKIIQGGEPVGLGYRGHVDVTPLDQSGKPFYNSDIGRYPELFAKEPGMVTIDERNGKWTCGEGNNRINHYLILDGREYGPMGDMVPGDSWREQPIVGLTSEYDEAGLTPVLLINYDVPLSEPHTLAYRAGYVGPDGVEIPSDPTSVVNENAWQVPGNE